MTYSLFAQASPQGGFMQMFIMLGMAVVFFYFIMWKPDQKRRQAAEAMRSALKKGDKVTAMAIVGTIDRFNQDTVVLKMIDGSKIEVLKASITEVHSHSNESSEASKEA